ncbi:MAG: hypothetical protein M3N16_04980 [Actinomycetota bacterium]|nr:hypothetical protein [Actinomycetota bacterium]
MNDKSELYDAVAALRAEVFELLEDLGHATWSRDPQLSGAAVALQNVANQLGAIEELVGPSERAAA